ncbi:hypothetical protein FG064_16235 [Vibrio cholerae]|nr:hypothetical protein [Vibrio cholerae]
MVYIIKESLVALALLALPLVIAFIYSNALRYLFVNAILSHRASRLTYRTLGLIGTPLHEISHLITALLFGHKIKSVKLFAWNNDAYVIHSYNPKSLWHSFGCLFIAISPFITSAMLIQLIMGDLITQYLWIPKMGMIDMAGLLSQLPEMLRILLLESHWWEITIVLIVSFYCTPSNSDFSNAIKSILMSLPSLIAMIIALDYLFDLSQLIAIVMIMTLLNLVSATIAWLILRGISLAESCLAPH